MTTGLAPPRGASPVEGNRQTMTAFTLRRRVDADLDPLKLLLILPVHPSLPLSVVVLALRCGRSNQTALPMKAHQPDANSWFEDGVLKTIRARTTTAPAPSVVLDAGAAKTSAGMPDTIKCTRACGGLPQQLVIVALRLDVVMVDQRASHALDRPEYRSGQRGPEHVVTPPHRIAYVDGPGTQQGGA